MRTRSIDPAAYAVIVAPNHLCPFVLISKFLTASAHAAVIPVDPSIAVFVINSFTWMYDRGLVLLAAAEKSGAASELLIWNFIV